MADREGRLRIRAVDADGLRGRRARRPQSCPATGLDVISNTVKVPFTIATAATAAPSAMPATTANATLKVTHDAKLGDVLVDTNGRTVYMFEKDQGTMSVCTGACAVTWPAVKASGTMAVGAGLDPSKLGSANGQVTYAGHLMYFYVGDGKPGRHHRRRRPELGRGVADRCPGARQLTELSRRPPPHGPGPLPSRGPGPPAAPDGTFEAVPTEIAHRIFKWRPHVD